MPAAGRQKRHPAGFRAGPRPGRVPFGAAGGHDAKEPLFERRRIRGDPGRNGPFSRRGGGGAGGPPAAQAPGPLRARPAGRQLGSVHGHRPVMGLDSGLPGPGPGPPRPDSARHGPTRTGPGGAGELEGTREVADPFGPGRAGPYRVRPGTALPGAGRATGSAIARGPRAGGAGAAGRFPGGGPEVLVPHISARRAGRKTRARARAETAGSIRVARDGVRAAAGHPSRRHPSRRYPSRRHPSRRYPRHFGNRAPARDLRRRPAGGGRRTGRPARPFARQCSGGSDQRRC